MNESYSLNSPVRDTFSLRIRRFTNDQGFNKPGSYSYFTVILLSKATGRLTADASQYTVEDLSLLTFSLYQPFEIDCPSAFEGYAFEFHPDFFCLHRHRSEVSCNGVLFNNIYESPLTKLSESEAAELSAVASCALSEIKRNDADSEALLSYLKVLLISATRIRLAQANKKSDKVKKTPAKLQELQSAIEDNFRSIHNAAGYADILNYSASVLNRACRDYFNKTLSELITDRIVLEAKRELYLTEKPVKAIAYDLGFNDEFHFSRYFKRNIGVSPQYFRDTVGAGKATVD